jgi:SAM-dependent methyltransferase
MPECGGDVALTQEEWDAWFRVQAGWTRPTRMWLYQEVGLAQGGVVLEVGCGTGAIVRELARLGASRVVGLDLDPAALDFAREQGGESGEKSSVTYVEGDAHELPFSDAVFDVVVCHYLLLWLADAARAVREMARVARPMGHILACAEPDYGGRVDYPPEMIALGRCQAEALRGQGADPGIGRRLGELFVAAGLRTTVGVMAGRWELPSSPDAGFEGEWTMRERDLAGLLSPEELGHLRSTDRQALEAGRRILFVPTFYAWGRKMVGSSMESSGLLESEGANDAWR